MKSYSKINLALSIVNKTKPNGLHELDSLNLITSLHDVIKVKFNEKGNNIKIFSNKDIPLDENNLVSKVINKFKKVFNLAFSVDVTIIKNIPIQAGLGGGSSNAACMLDILNKKFKTNMNALEKINFLKDITSDGPLFVLNTTCRVKGKGNIISPIKHKFKYKILLVKPFSGCNTKDVYNNIDYKKLNNINMNKIEEAFINDDFDSLCKRAFNDLLDSACKVNKEISDILLRLKSCGFDIVSISGSGSTCFAIAKSKFPYKAFKKIINKNDYELVRIVKAR